MAQEHITKAIKEKYGSSSGFLNPSYDSFIQLIVDTERQRIKEEIEKLFREGEFDYIRIDAYKRQQIMDRVLSLLEDKK